MEKKRLQRMIIVALLGIALVLLITILSERGQRKNANPGGDAPVVLEAGQAPPDPTKTTNPGTIETRDPSRLLGRGGRAVIDVTDPKTGRLIRRVSYSEMEPLAEGVFEVKQPRATFFVTPRRVIQLRSDEGRLEAPGNVPQSGTLSGNIVITLFDSQTDKPADLSPESPDRVVTIEVADEATFNTTLGEIHTASDIVVFTPVTEQVRFEGTGLNLVFNEPEQRIEYLEVLKGKSLKYRPGAGALTLEQKKPAPAVKPDATPTPKPVANPDAPVKPEPKPDPVQHYRVTFEREVLATMGDRSIDADTLVAYFSFARSDTKGEDKAKPGVDAKDAPPAATATPAAPAPPAAPAGAPAPDDAIAQAKAAAKSKKEADKTPEEAVITWSGKLVMVPMDGPHEKMTHDRDTFVTFTGKPIVASMENGERLLCHTLEYLQSTGDVTAIGSAAYPLRIQAPSLGTVEAERLAMAMGGDSARLIGPGSIRALAADEQPKPDAAAKPDAKDVKDAKKPIRPRGLPANFRASWTEGVDLKFAQAAEPGSGIESADFKGRVRIDDERFKLRAERLVTHFDAPPPKPAKPAKPGAADAAKPESALPTDRQLSAIDAEGKVNVTFSDGTIQAGKLRLDTAPNPAGKLVPSRLEAQRDVVVNNPKQRLAAQFLTVTLAEAPPKLKAVKKPKADAAAPADAPAPEAVAADAQAAPVDGADKLAVGDHDTPVGKSIEESLDVVVRNVVAIDAVELVEHSVGRRVRAERLDADAASGEARLIGSPVIVTEHDKLNPDGVAPEGARPVWELHVLNVTIHDNGKTLTTEGPGKFIYTEYHEDKKPKAKPGDKQPDAVDAPDKKDDAKAAPDAGAAPEGAAEGDAAAPDAAPDKKPDPPRRVKVTWTQRMRYEHDANRLDVFGDVLAQAEDSPTELNSLEGESMTMELVDPDLEKKILAEPSAGAAPKPADAKPAPPADPAPGIAVLGANADVAVPVDTQFDRRLLRKLTARGNVVLRAVRFTDETHENALTRLRISGPTLEYLNVSKNAQVIGPGSMLIEDYRRSKKAGDNTKAAPMSGRGQTLFTWKHSMTLDGERADMILKGEVQMAHKPIDRSELMEMRTDLLTADMKAAGEFNPTGMTKVESMDIDHIRADGAVQLRDPTQSKIASTADHLHYDGNRKTVDLLADPKGRVTIYRLDQAKPLKGKAFRWNLAEDSFEVLDPGF
ncbi:MAG: hypothetical protein GC159_12255 [Phycisphaera sp.]|nr:hypothetical protein [Phycisphaera sp.]